MRMRMKRVLPLPTSCHLGRPFSTLGRGAATCQFGTTLQERNHNQTNKLLIVESLELSKKTEIGVLGIQAGERVDFEKLRQARFVIADIDTPAVAAAKHAPCSKGDFSSGICLFVLDQ